ncbi:MULTISPECIES: phospholipase D family protein [unclassified Simplicispira]|uniref:phospholipase D-like domain-containing protein n=2 Tax=unclassified Simplicispira TaxID=2630407 RepID=UPI001F430E7C|nr:MULTISPECIES: phospholipase D family protein [unclassified Simplicispira]
MPPTHKGWRAWLAGIAALLATGCSGLPQEVDRPVSHALTAPSGTTLGRLVQERHKSAGARFPSGFQLLSGPQAAYSSRLALVEAAEKTLDLQYYAIHADASTERLLTGVVAAARRGVRVRVLLDDFHSTGRDAQVMRLAFEPNIEMRMFNPVPGARGSGLGRMLSMLADFKRMQQRMHNKLFIADNAMGVSGGRNLGDAYFGNAESGNFVDMDVLAAGPVVQELSRSFDSYWNNQRAYPVQSLITRKELDALRSSFDASDAATPATPNPTTEPQGQPQGSDAQRAYIWNQEPMDLAQAGLVWAPAAVLVDQPAKIPSDEPNGAVPLPERAPSGASPLSITARKTPGTPAAAPVAGDAATDTVVDGLLQLMGYARKELLIISPYFVPGPDMLQAFAAARARGVRVRVLTNSLASNDAPIAHVGYARHRPELLAMGVELFEMRSELAGLRGAFSSSGSTGGSRAMLHSKLLVMDERLLAVGSMNLDQRSQRQNTEIALLIRSKELSGQVTERIKQALGAVAWEVTLTEDRQLRWHAPQGSDLPDSHTEPDTSLPLRLMLRLLGPLAPDSLL